MERVFLLFSLAFLSALGFEKLLPNKLPLKICWEVIPGSGYFNPVLQWIMILMQWRFKYIQLFMHVLDFKLHDKISLKCDTKVQNYCELLLSVCPDLLIPGSPLLNTKLHWQHSHFNNNHKKYVKQIILGNLRT